jgi:hypothetical protein
MQILLLIEFQRAIYLMSIIFSLLGGGEGCVGVIMSNWQTYKDWHVTVIQFNPVLFRTLDLKIETNIP